MDLEPKYVKIIKNQSFLPSEFNIGRKVPNLLEAGQTGQPGGSVTNICQKNKYIRLNNQLSVYGFLRECVNFFFVRVCDEFFG